MTKVIGLTGGIASGKSQTAAIFSSLGVRVFDADACVHKLYQGELVPLIEGAFPGTVDEGQVNRERLAAHLKQHPDDFSRLNKLVHPYVERERLTFIAEARAAGCELVVLDIPLLFETKADSDVDKIVLAWVDEKTQKQRALQRTGMTEDKLEMILAQQIPLDEKRVRADYIIDTRHGIKAAEDDVKKLITQLV